MKQKMTKLLYVNASLTEALQFFIRHIFPFPTTLTICRSECVSFVLIIVCPRPDKSLHLVTMTTGMYQIAKAILRLRVHTV